MTDYVGTTGDDVFTFGDIPDRLFGLAGDDTYFVKWGGNVYEEAGEGYDIVYAEPVTSGDFPFASLRAGQHVEEIRLQDPSSTGTTNISGNEFAQLIVANDGVNELRGGGGGDTLVGLGGGDRYYISHAGDTVIEAAGGGTDAVILQVSVDYQLGAGQHIESLDARQVSGAVSLIGNEFANIISGNSHGNFIAGGGGADTLLGGAGDDVYLVTDAAARVVESASQGNDIVYVTVDFVLESGTEVEALFVDEADSIDPISLTGNNFAQIIAGNAGANFLAGGFGADTLVGRTGDDTYLITDSAARVYELAGEGQDIVYTTVSYTLAAGMSVEALFVDVASTNNTLTLTGNEFAQTIAGNAGANTLIGGGGADVLVGRAGDDTYLITDASARIFETAGEGQDIAYASVNYALDGGMSVEALFAVDAASTAAINLFGNALAQTIAGNAGANTLSSGGGADLLVGRGGDDLYFVSDSAARVWELAGEGQDYVYSTVSYALEAGISVEALLADGSDTTAAINLSGNEVAQIVAGNAGANVLNGGAGADTLVGRGGADSFAFTTTLGGGNVDFIFDYDASSDQFLLDDAVFTGLAPGTLAAGAFVTGSAAADADDRIIYNSATGALLFDADGSGAGAAVQFATLSTGLSLTAGEFTVI